MIDFIKYFIDLNYVTRLVIVLIVVGLLALSNILGNLYYNVGKRKQLFNIDKFINGFIKVIIVVCIIFSITISFIAFKYLEIVDANIVDPFILFYGIAILYFKNVIEILYKIFNYKEEINEG